MSTNTEEIVVKIGDTEFPTIIDEEGVQRFKANALFRHLVNSGMVDLNRLFDAYLNGSFSQAEYLAFYAGIGYTVCGIKELTFFADLTFANPLESTKKV